MAPVTEAHEPSRLSTRLTARPLSLVFIFNPIAYPAAHIHYANRIGHAETTMTDTIIRSGSNKEVLTSERCHIRERLNDRGVPRVSVAGTRVEPGVTTQLHRLAVDEWYLISSGEGLMEVGDAPPVKVGSGDIVTIPASTSQRITNTGDDDLIFDCICLPRFTPECYESLE
jgi:mannose-6-phosphate isomerase-like protein (cupin superfamily)